MSRLRPRLLALAAACALLAGGCGGGSGGGAPLPAFYFASSIPVPDSTFVARDQVVSVTFNKAIDPASILPNSLVVTGGAGAVNGTTVLVENGTGRKLQWTPSQLMAQGALHTCRLHTGLRSVDAEPLGGATSFNFVTSPEGPPAFIPSPLQLRPALGALNAGRQDHEATLLATGQVLITGGFTQGATTTDRAEIYLSGSETFIELASPMVQARGSHTATRLADGRVLLCGGWLEQSPGNAIPTHTAELFVPGSPISSSTFVPVGNMTKPRVGHAALLLPDGNVLITGGSQLNGTFLADHDDAEVFDPTTGQFTAYPEMLLHTRSDHGMADLGDGTFLLAGGSDQDLRNSIFDTATGLFADIGSGAGELGRFGPAVGVYASGAATVSGGDVAGQVLHVYAGGGPIVNTGSGLNAARSYATSTRIAPDMLLVAGGIDFSQNSFLLASCDLVREDPTPGLGGSRTYGTDVRFTHGMAWHTATVLPTGEILYCGGLNADGSQPNHTAAFLFTP